MHVRVVLHLIVLHAVARPVGTAQIDLSRFARLRRRHLIERRQFGLVLAHHVARELLDFVAQPPVNVHVGPVGDDDQPNALPEFTLSVRPLHGASDVLGADLGHFVGDAHEILGDVLHCLFVFSHGRFDFLFHLLLVVKEPVENGLRVALQVRFAPMASGTRAHGEQKENDGDRQRARRHDQRRRTSTGARVFIRCTRFRARTQRESDSN